MMIMIVSDDGQVLDSESITREELDNLSPAGALALLAAMQTGGAA